MKKKKTAKRQEPPESDLKPLSAGQAEIMQIIWDRGELSAIEVTEILSERRPVSRNAVKTNLDRIEDKGWLTHRVIGRTYFYQPTVDRAQGLSARLLSLMDRACGGDPQKLMMAFLDSRPMSMDEIQSIQSVLDEAKKNAVQESRDKPQRKKR